MARINIEDSLHSEKEFKRLVRMLNGNEDQAVGLLYRFWREAQNYWGEDRGLMSKEEFLADGFAPILEVGLASHTMEGIKAKWSEEMFDWYLQRKAASKKGGSPGDEKKRLARQAVNNAIVHGKLIRPTECEECGSQDRKLDGHHSDYDKPLDVEWLCRSCHRGLRHGKAADKPANEGRITGEHAVSNGRITGIEAPVNPLSLSLSLAPSLSLKTNTNTGISESLSQELPKALTHWEEVLKHHGAERKLLAGEQTQIAGAIQRYGSEAVTLAFLGAQWEPASEDNKFKPSRYLSLKRIFDPTKFERFVTLGAQAKKQMREKAEQKERERLEREEVDRWKN